MLSILSIFKAENESILLFIDRSKDEQLNEHLMDQEFWFDMLRLAYKNSAKQKQTPYLVSLY